MYYIYSITNLINKKQYIGRTKRPQRRLYEHFITAKSGKPNKFYNAIRKHGDSNFTFEIIAICGSEEESKIIEKEYIRIYDTVYSGYNTRFGGEGISKKDLALLWSDPNYIAKQSAAKKKHWANKEYRDRMCKQSKDKSNPEFLRSIARKNWEDPEKAKRMSQGRLTGRVPVVCLETLKKYGCLSEAERETGVKRRSIELNIKGRTFRAGKLHWISTNQDISKISAENMILDLENKRRERLCEIWRLRKNARNQS